MATWVHSFLMGSYRSTLLSADPLWEPPAAYSHPSRTDNARAPVETKNGERLALRRSCCRKITPQSRLEMLATYTRLRQTALLSVWLSLIQRCDWLPEGARWDYLVHSGLLAGSRKKIRFFFHITNPSLPKLVWSRLLDINLVLFSHVYGSLLRSINTQKVNLANILPS